MQKINNRYSVLAAAVIMIIFLALRVSNPPKNILSYDVFGYYLYLPAIVIYDDPGIKDISWVQRVNEKYHASPSLYQLSRTPENNWVIRFYSGIAIMCSPFFLAGHVTALLTSYEADGFSLPYQWAIILSGIFYTLAGVWFLRKALLTLFDDATTAITLLLIFIGSNVFFFSTWGSDAPHIYIFTLFAIIIWLTSKWYSKPTAANAIALGLVTGLTMITRPSEVLIVLIPVLWGIWSFSSVRDKFKLIWKRRRDVILMILFAAVAVMPQFIYWKLASGQWIFNSYDDPQSGFNLTNPRIAYVLFGFRKGLFVYSPMMIFATIGFFPLLKQQKGLFLAVLTFFLATIYLIASYSSLISYGWRAFIEVHAVLALPLACLVNWTLKQKKAIKIILLSLFFLVLLLNLFKSWQVLRGVIDGSRMTQAYFIDSFFATDKNKTDQSLLLVQRSEESIESFIGNGHFQHRVLAFNDFEDTLSYNSKQLDTNYAFEGNYSLKLNKDFIYSKAIEIPFKDITSNYYAWLRASVWIYKTGDPEDDESILVIHFNYENRPYKYRGISFKNQGIPFEEGTWNKLSIDYMTPEVRTTDDPVKVYLWYRGKGEIYIDNLTLEVFEPK